MSLNVRKAIIILDVSDNWHVARTQKKKIPFFDTFTGQRTYGKESNSGVLIFITRVLH